MVQKQQITVGAMVSFQVYLTMIVWPMISAGDLVNVMQQGAASWRRINEVLQTQDDLEQAGPKMLPAVAKITFENYDFSYPSSSNKVLQHIDLTIKKVKLLGLWEKLVVAKLPCCDSCSIATHIQIKFRN